MASGGIKSLLDEWEELNGDHRELEVANRAYRDKLDEVSEYQKRCQKNIAHQRYRMGIISKDLQKLNVQLEVQKKEKGPIDQDTLKKIDELKTSMLKRTAHLMEVEQTLPKKNDTYLKIIIGNVNVSILNKEEKFKYKDEYEKFKLILSIIGFILALLNLQARNRPLELIYIFLLVWYYCTLTIRESILKVNGSRIKGWWRLHHFISTVAAAILLIWPDNQPWLEFRNQFMWFNGYISVVQYLQFRYQRGQLYRLKTLGERHNMDITIEGFHSWMWRGLSFLFPFLFIGYLFQLYNAYSLYYLSFLPSATWHVPVLSFIFLVLFTGNTLTTVMVVPNKLRDQVFTKYRVMC